jgi:hypothetical protein
MSCPAFCGAYSSIPERISPESGPADVKALRCQRQGSECCEWRFTWRNPKPGPSVLFWGGIAASLLLLAAALSPLPGHAVLGILALLPALLGWHAWRIRELRYEHERQDRALSELQPLAEELHTQADAVQARSQLGGLELARRGDWLEALNEMSQAIGADRDRDEILKAGLSALSAHNIFDRGFALLLDRDKGLLAGGPSVGGGPEAAARLQKLEESLGESAFAAVLQASGPTILASEQLRESSVGSFWVTLATRELAAVPLSAGGRAFGLLMVDNTYTGRPVTDEDQRLLQTAASILASGLDRAYLRTQVDADDTHATREKKPRA